MAKKSGAKAPPVTDRTIWYTDLAFFPPEFKDKLWMSQGLFYAKNNSTQFLDTKRKLEYRKLDRGEINERIYKELIDPPSPMNTSGGIAEYFAADWKTCPIDMHLDNILLASLDKIAIENKIQVDTIDKFSMSQKMKDKHRILYQQEFRKIINGILVQLGMKPIKASQDPYKYAESLGKDEAAQAAGSVDTILDYIKNQVKDDQDLALYESYIYKGDIELAFELGIEHFLINLNKWRIVSERFNHDIKNFNKYCGRAYTDEISGRLTVQYLEPDMLRTSPFQSNNGEDIQFWYYEYPVTFSDFVRMFGTTLTDIQLKEVFELNRNQGGTHGMTWQGSRSFKGSNAAIMIGIYSVLTQDAEKFSEEFVNNKIPAYRQKPASWIPEEGEREKQRIYNTWYSCYYVPPPSSRTAQNQQADWVWQSQYIFNLKKDIDMYRMGVDDRYAKSTLVIYKDERRMSYTDIKEAFMPKIRTTWHKFQNCLVQDITALAISKDFIQGLLNAADEGNKINLGDPEYATGGNGEDAAMVSMKQLKQGGTAFFDFRDSKGNPIVDPSKLFVYVDTKHVEKAERYLKLIMDQYQLMTVSLASNDISEGQDAKPRTNEASIVASLQAVDKGRWFVEKPVRECMIMFGERCVQHILCIVKEKKKYGHEQRWVEFQSAVGLSNSMLLESVEDLQPEEIGLTVDLVDVSSMQQYFTNLTVEMAKNGTIDQSDVEMITQTIHHNYKYGSFLLNLSIKKKAEEKAHQEELAFERQMQLNKSLMQEKTAGKDQNIMTEGKMQAAIAEAIGKMKAETMAASKEQIAQNRMRQDANKAELNKDGKEHEANIEAQKPLD